MTNDTSPMNTIHLIDSTLRDGEQTPGVRFSLKAKREIARALDAAGISEIEAGIPAMGGEFLEEIESLLRLRLNAEISVWCRARVQDLNRAASIGVKRVHLALPSSDRLLRTQHKDLAWLTRRALHLTAIAKRRFTYVSVGFMDASRTPDDRLVFLAGLAQEGGADRVRLADTVGVWDPFAVDRVFRQLRYHLPELSLGFHGHNDLGMATANALAAVRAGAEWVDVTVNGLGDRAGNVPLAEAILALETRLGRKTGVHTETLSPLSTMVAEHCGQPVPEDKPVVGSRVFRHEAGIHVHGLLQDRLSFQPFLPERVGRETETFVIGPHSGRAAHAFQKAGVA
jgi:homocitrate synthase NifV